VILALLPLRESRGEVEADFAELFLDRQARYGRGYAHRRLLADIVSLWRGTPRGGHVLQDLRFGLRLFGKHPLPVGLAIAGLALSIGVVTAVFSLVNATRLRPFDMDDPSSVVQVTRRMFEGWVDNQWSYQRFLDMRSWTSVSGVEASMEDHVRVSPAAAADSAPERDVLFVSGGYLEMLGGRAAIGRSLTPDDDRPGAPPVVVISHDLWAAEFGSDVAAVGSTIWIGRGQASIVGVMRDRFSGPVRKKPSVWAPFAAFGDLVGVAETYTINGRTPASMAGEAFTPTSRTLVEVVARLAPGVSMAVAEENVAAIVHAAESSANPKAKPSVVRLFSAASPIDGPQAAESYLEIASILAIVGLVLAVACAKTANLLLAAAATRTREIGVRLALGATSRRLLGQMVSESLMLGLVAGILGFMFALWFSPLLGVLVGIDAGVDLSPDFRVLAFAVVVATVCGLGAGIAPARFGARGNLLAVLQSQSGSAGRTAVPSRLRTSFVGFQAAVSMLLLVASALLARTAVHMTRIDAGFDAERLLVATITTPEKGFDESAYFRRAVDAVSAIPSVERVGLSALRPFGHSRRTVTPQSERHAYTLFVSSTDARALSAIGIRLLRGRFFTDEESDASAPVALISEGVADRYFHGLDPIGQPLSRLPLSSEDPERTTTIIGVVANALLDRVFTENFGTIHLPLRRPETWKGPVVTSPPTLIVRTANPAAAARAVEDALRKIDPRARPTTGLLSSAVEEFVHDKRTLAWLAGPMAGLALLLAALGVYGVTAFVASRRTLELSVRMALGASAADVRRLLVSDGLRPVLIGLAVGLVAAIGAGQVFRSVLAGVSPTDPFAIGVAGGTLFVSALVAVLIPARRAARVDPASILRES
jgi:predicted permease